MVFEHRGEYESQWAVVVSIAAKTGSTPRTPLNWVRQHQRDSGQREGTTTAEAQRVKELEREVRRTAQGQREEVHLPRARLRLGRYGPRRKP